MWKQHTPLRLEIAVFRLFELLIFPRIFIKLRPSRGAFQRRRDGRGFRVKGCNKAKGGRERWYRNQVPLTRRQALAEGPICTSLRSARDTFFMKRELATAGNASSPLGGSVCKRRAGTGQRCIEYQYFVILIHIPASSFFQT